MSQITIHINGIPYEVEEGLTILEAARSNGIQIPNLCYLKDVHQYGACRICVVEVEGMKNLVPSCMIKASSGMKIKTGTPKLRRTRKLLYELLLSDHPQDCLTCFRNGACELAELGATLGVTDRRIHGEKSVGFVDVSPSITRDTNKCILCRRCVTVCNQIQEVGAISCQNRGFKAVISPAMNLPLDDVHCAMCGQCTVVCPTGALRETNSIETVWKALEDPGKITVVQVAPAVRAALGEEFGMPTGTRCTGKIAASLRELGFDHIFDTEFAADITIMEEGTELLHRLQAALTGGEAILPMITSCSPGWIKHIEHAFSQELHHLSTCKSPQSMMGALVKSFYAQKIGMDPKDLYVISVMPCTAKKFEIRRPAMGVDGIKDVDAVLTTRELAKMIKSAGIHFGEIGDRTFDAPLSLSSGAGDIFGVTGGVLEAALRTAYEEVTGREVPFERLHVTPIVGMEKIKEAEIRLNDVLPEYAYLEGVNLKVAATSSLAGANELMRDVAAGTSPYHFIEVMGCPGGCINGGGQPRSREEGYLMRRMEALYEEDESKTIRKSHENPDVLTLYREFLGEPGGEMAHHLLHTTYTPRGRYNELLKQS